MMTRRVTLLRLASAVAIVALAGIVCAEGSALVLAAPLAVVAGLAAAAVDRRLTRSAIATDTGTSLDVRAFIGPAAASSAFAGCAIAFGSGAALGMVAGIAAAAALTRRLKR